VMAVAILTAKLPEIHELSDVANAELIYLAAFVWLVLRGPGPVSVDHLIARQLGLHGGPRVGVAPRPARPPRVAKVPSAGVNSGQGSACFLASASASDFARCTTRMSSADSRASTGGR